jgi:hypothetical protein
VFVTVYDLISLRALSVVVVNSYSSLVRSSEPKETLLPGNAAESLDEIFEEI